MFTFFLSGRQILYLHVSNKNPLLINYYYYYLLDKDVIVIIIIIIINY